MKSTASLCKIPPAPHLRVSVIVPAKNEEAYITQTLQALYDQTDAGGKALDKSCYEVIVLANNCSDATASVVQRFAVTHPDFALHVAEQHFPAEQANIGFVRRTLMDEAYCRLTSLGKPYGIIASTDGDSVVNSTWVFHTLQAFAQGADAVGGRILTPAHRSDYRRYYLQDVMYRYLQAQLESLVDPNPADPWPRHFQNFGPSLAVTCAMYEQAGRLPVVPYLEDVYFYEAMQRCDARIRHCPRVQVLTSPRAEGRVAFGFSKQLQKWATMNREGSPFEVPSGQTWLFRFQLQRQLREAWQVGTYQSLSRVEKQMGAPVRQFFPLITSFYFGHFLFHIMRSPEMVNHLGQRFPLVPIAEATQELRTCIREVKNEPLQTLIEPPTSPVDIAPLVDDADAVMIDYLPTL